MKEASAESKQPAQSRYMQRTVESKKTCEVLHMQFLSSGPHSDVRTHMATHGSKVSVAGAGVAGVPLVGERSSVLDSSKGSSGSDSRMCRRLLRVFLSACMIICCRGLCVF